MASFQAELLLQVIYQAKKDIEDFLRNTDPKSIKRLIRAESLATTNTQNTELTTWKPSDFTSALSFFDTELFGTYCELLDLEPENIKERVFEDITYKYGGLPGTLLDFAFEVKGEGDVSRKMSMSRIVEIVVNLTKADTILWKESNESYVEVREPYFSSEMLDLSNFLHQSTYVGTSDKSTILYYLGVFTKSDKEDSKHRKYLLFIAGDDGRVYEIPSVGRLAKVVTEMFVQKEPVAASRKNAFLEMITYITKKEGYDNADMSEV